MQCIFYVVSWKLQEHKQEVVQVCVRLQATVLHQAAVVVVEYLEAYGDHSATDLLPHHELFSQHGQYDVLPEATGQTFPQTDDPLPPTAVRLVLTGENVT